MKSKPGTYALILKSDSKETIKIGRRLEIYIEPGYYIYVGSAFGPGGVKSRVLRHFRKKKSMHWHIDYLRNFLVPVGAWYSYDSNHLEHQWAQTLLKNKEITSIKGFGCSDCECYSHLFYTYTEPELSIELSFFSTVMHPAGYYDKINKKL